jgi:hypothetical protein
MLISSLRREVASEAAFKFSLSVADQIMATGPIF